MLNHFIEKVKDVSDYKSVISNDKIEFLCKEEVAGFAHAPVPASKVLPDWYKNLDMDEETVEAGTVRNCASFLDAMSMGWIIKLSCDIEWNYGSPSDRNPEKIENIPNISWTSNVSNWDQIGFHGPFQIEGFPITAPTIKFMNPWVIKTPPGYSTLFTHPFNRPDKRFRHFSGVVETDKYFNNAQGGAIWLTEPGTSGIMERGTPIVQIIPFKRDSYIQNAEARVMTQEEENKQKRLIQRIDAGKHWYRENAWEPTKATRTNDKRDLKL